MLSVLQSRLVRGLTAARNASTGTLVTVLACGFVASRFMATEMATTVAIASVDSNDAVVVYVTAPDTVVRRGYQSHAFASMFNFIVRY